MCWSWYSQSLVGWCEKIRHVPTPATYCHTTPRFEICVAIMALAIAALSVATLEGFSPINFFPDKIKKMHLRYFNRTYILHNFIYIHDVCVYIYIYITFGSRFTGERSHSLFANLRSETILRISVRQAADTDTSRFAEGCLQHQLFCPAPKGTQGHPRAGWKPLK